MTIALVIPSLHPSDKLINLVREVQNHSLTIQKKLPIIVVDDGSGEQYAHIFSMLEKDFNCTILTHAVNLGKGRALKTAFNYFLNNYPARGGVITADSDGQHDVTGIFDCLLALETNPSKLILGCRQFDKEGIPFKSRAGNIITRNIFKFLCGIKVSDTQTGLRGISSELMKKTIKTDGERFEYEMNMLIQSKEFDTEILEVPISTIYINDNESSHFNPIVDSFKIYSLFFKFIFSSISSFVIDISIFSVLMIFLKKYAFAIIISTAIARLFSSFFNYRANQKAVFKKGETSNTLWKYYLLAAVQMIASALLVNFFAGAVSINVSLIKMAVDGLLFLLSFQIQRNVVFT